MTGAGSLRRYAVPAVAAWLALAAVLALGTVPGLLDPRLVRTTDNLAQLGSALLATLACARTARAASGTTRRSWTATAVGAGAWACGATVWAAYELGGTESPFPSPADAGYLVFPVAVTLGLLLLPGAVSPLRRGRDLLDGVMVAAAVAAIGWVTTLGAAVRDGGQEPLALTVAVAYPLGDVVLLTAALLAWAQGTARRRTLGLFGAALLAMVVSDGAFTYLTADGTYSTGALVDLGWVAAFGLLGLAAVDARLAGAGQADGRGTDREDDLPGLLAGLSAARDEAALPSVLPYAPLLLALGVLVATPSARSQAVSLLLVAVAGTAAFARQWLTVRDNVGLVDEVAARESALRRQACLDPLTGLPNRTLLAERISQGLERHRRDGRPLAVVFCDLDAFKGVNDGLGHAAGDALLVAVAERLGSALRGEDTLARLGGDEFAALVEDPAVAEIVARRMAGTLLAPFTLADGTTLHARASFGVAVVARDDPTPTLDDLLARADVAMYVAKRAGGARVALHEQGMTLREARDLALHLPLVAAVERDEVELHYQPVVDLRSGRVVSFEALARWEHDGGPVPPDVFIPLARRTGLLPRLTANLLDRACAQTAAWTARLGHRGVVVAVNISPDQIVDHHLVDQVLAALQRHDVEPYQLTLEITEEALLTDLVTAAEVTGRLRALGVSLSLDDFGTGYSSLAHLHRIPLSAVKIDRAFVRRIAEDDGLARLVRGVIALGTGMGLSTVAEGIEEPDQAQALAALGCRLGQGYLYSRPRPADELCALVATVAPPRDAPADGVPVAS